MNINIKFDKSFTTALNKITNDGDPNLAVLNGFSMPQLNYTDFIDNFVDKQNVSDSSIDSNANVGTKDVCSLLTEMNKPHMKLLSFNKLFYEISKKYGHKVATDWLEAEYDGHFYLHDSPSATFLSYCYKGEELLTVKYNDSVLNLSMKELYDIVEEKEEIDVTINEMVKRPVNLYVLDLDENNNEVYTKVTRLLGHSNDKPMRFIKYANGYSQIVTEDHPIITQNGDVPAKDVTLEDFVYSVKPSYFSNTIDTIDISGESFKLNKELGWLVGVVLSEASSRPSSVVIYQSKESLIYEHILNLLNKYNISYKIREERKIYLKVCPISKWLEKIIINKTSNLKSLPADYLHYSYDFLDGVVAGVIDGDGTIDGYKNRHCQIRLSSEVLVHQLSNYLNFKGVFCGDRVPFRYNYEGSFNQILPIFGIGFPLTDEEYFKNIRSFKIADKYVPLIRDGNFKNKKYSYLYGYVNVIENSEYIDSCETVYDITTESGHFLCNNILSHNCYAYDIERLIKDGLFFVDKFNNQPPKHLNTYTDFIGEFVSWTANRSSGACGLPSFLIYSFYFWNKDKKSGHYSKNPEYYRDQEFQRIIYKLNQPYLRVNQCVTEDVEVLTPNGFKTYDNLNVGDDIYTWNNGICEIQKVQAVNVSDYEGELDSYNGRDLSFDVTPNHKILYKKPNTKEYYLRESNDLLKTNAPVTIPVAMNNNFEDYDISDEELELLVITLREGNSKNPVDLTDGEKTVLPKFFTKLSQRQAKIVIDVWSRFDGDNQGSKNRRKLQCDNFEIADGLQHVCFLAGLGSKITTKKIGNNKNETIYVSPFVKNNKDVNNNYKKFYSGKVWCPTTENGVVVFRKNGVIFISGNSAFTNFTIFDRDYLVELFGGKEFPDGTFIIDYIDDILDYQKDFMRVSSEIREQNMMTFPVLTFALLWDGDKYVNEDYAKWCCEHNMRWADSNFYSSSDVTTLSNCCRLISNVEQLGYFNSIGGTALEVGSVKVNTINLARLSYENNQDAYFEALEQKTLLNLQALDTVRLIISRNIDKGLLPNYTMGVINLANQYNTIGIIGIYETLQKYGMVNTDEFGYVSYSDEGIEFAKKILKTIDNVRIEFAKGVDYKINIEQVPAERAASVLMEKDRIYFPNEIYELPLYANQWIPLAVKTTIKEKIRVSAILDIACNGGSITHINLAAPFTDFKQAWKMLNEVAKANVKYFSFCVKINVCKYNHSFYGDTCPYCNTPVVSTVQRIVGFLTDERNYSKERKQEFDLRDWFGVE